MYVYDIHISPTNFVWKFAFTETNDNQRAEQVTGNVRKIGQVLHASCLSFIS